MNPTKRLHTPQILFADIRVAYQETVSIINLRSFHRTDPKSDITMVFKVFIGLTCLAQSAHTSVARGRFIYWQRVNPMA